MIGGVKADVVDFNQQWGTWPTGVTAAVKAGLGGLGYATNPSSKYVTKVEVAAGAINITFGNQANTILKAGVLTVRPGRSPNGDYSWICGRAPVPAGIVGVGASATTIIDKYLPANCRT
jgi:hypothetical protein